MKSSLLPIDAQENPGVTQPADPLLVPGVTRATTPIERMEPPIASVPQKHRLPIKRLALITTALLAVGGLGLFVHQWWTAGRFTQTTDDAYVGGNVTMIAPKVPGLIARVAIVDNQAVRAGDLLVTLDDREYRAALAKTEATVAMQQAALVNLDAQSHLQEAVIAQARAEINATEAEMVRTRDDRARYQGLLGTGAVSVQNFQQADADHKRALAIATKAQAALEAAQRQLVVIAAQREQVRAALSAAVAERDLAQLNLGYTELRAPIDGIIGNRSAQVGAYATTGAQLISLVPAHGLWIDANFKESQVGRIHPGSPAEVEVDLLPGKKFRGHVVSIAPATGAQFSVLPPENATGNFTKIVQRLAVRILLEEEPGVLEQLRPGLSVTAQVDTRSSTDGQPSNVRAGL